MSTGDGSGGFDVTSVNVDGCVGSVESMGGSPDTVGWMTLLPFASLPGMRRGSSRVLGPVVLGLGGGAGATLSRLSLVLGSIFRK